MADWLGAPPSFAAGLRCPRRRGTSEGAAPEPYRAHAGCSPQPPGACAVRAARGMPGAVLRPLSESVATLRCFPDSMVRAALGRGHKELADVTQEEPGVGDNDSKAALVPLHQALDGWREGMGALVPWVLPREGPGGG